MTFVSFSFLEFTMANIQKTLILSHKFFSGSQGPLKARCQSLHIQFWLPLPCHKPQGLSPSPRGLYLEYYFTSLLQSAHAIASTQNAPFPQSLPSLILLRPQDSPSSVMQTVPPLEPRAHCSCLIKVLTPFALVMFLFGSLLITYTGRFLSDS